MKEFLTLQGFGAEKVYRGTAGRSFRTSRWARIAIPPRKLIR